MVAKNDNTAFGTDRGAVLILLYDHNTHGGESTAKLFAKSMVFLVGDNIKGTVFGKALIFSLIGIDLDLRIGVGCC